MSEITLKIDKGAYGLACSQPLLFLRKTSADPSARTNFATSTNQNLPSKFWKVTSVDLGVE